MAGLKIKAMSVGGEQLSPLSTLQYWGHWRRWHLKSGGLSYNSPTRAF